MGVNLKLALRRIALGPALLLICGLNFSGCQSGTTDAATRGKELFETCVPCHQQDGSGSPVYHAPNIAGMNEWYIERELGKFRSGARGTNFDDTEGMRMRPMSLSLLSDQDVSAVAHYVASLPQVREAPSVSGDAKVGGTLYLVCQSCHGEKGAGDEKTGAPRIAGVDDWYLATELRKFKSGIRGGNPKDREGRAMRAMAGTLPDEDAIRNVVAYIGTLNP